MVERSPSVVSVEPVSVLFQYGTSRPNSDTTGTSQTLAEELQRTLQALQRTEDVSLVVTGHADPPQADFNDALSWGRAILIADSVAVLLRAQGWDGPVYALGKGVEFSRRAELAVASNAAWEVKPGPSVPLGRGCLSVPNRPSERTDEVEARVGLYSISVYGTGQPVHRSSGAQR